MHPDLLSHIVKRLPIQDRIKLAQINSLIYTRFTDQLSLKPFINESIKKLNGFCSIFFGFDVPDDNYLYEEYDDESYVYDLNSDKEAGKIDAILGEDGWLRIGNQLMIEKHVIDNILSTIIPAAKIYISVKPDEDLELRIDQNLVLQFQPRAQIKNILGNIKEFKLDDADEDQHLYFLKGFEIVSYDNNELRLYAVIEY